MREIPFDMLKQIFFYDALSGLVYWNIPRRNGVKAGDIAGNIDATTGYVRVTFAQKVLRTHRIAWALSYGEWPTLDIDHINNIRSDNRINNLRLASRAENIRNKKKHSNTKCTLKGVTPYINYEGKYVAQINIFGKQKNLGVFDSEQAAHNKYCEVASEVFGKFYNPDCSCHQSGF